MDLRQLTYFVHVLEAGSFTRAAEVLHMAQPALSQQIQKLEEELGQKLLLRHSRGVVVTEAGARFLRHVTSILRSVDAARQDMRLFHGEARQEIKLGIPRSLGTAIAVELRHAWVDRLPEMSLSLVEFMNTHLVEWLLTGRLDLALSYAPDDAQRLRCLPVLRESFCLVGPASLGQAGHLGEISLAESADKNLILPSSFHDNRKVIDAAADYCGVRLKVAHEIDSVELSLALIDAGIGYSIQPFLSVQHLLATRRLALWHIVQPEITRRLQIAYASEQPLSREMPRVLEELRLYLRQFLDRVASPLITAELEDDPA